MNLLWGTNEIKIGKLSKDVEIRINHIQTSWNATWYYNMVLILDIRIFFQGVKEMDYYQLNNIEIVRILGQIQAIQLRDKIDVTTKNKYLLTIDTPFLNPINGRGILYTCKKSTKFTNLQKINHKPVVYFQTKKVIRLLNSHETFSLRWFKM